MIKLTHRSRRRRYQASIRALVEENLVTPRDLIAPLFLIDGHSGPQPVASMPGVFRHNLDDLCREAETLHRLGVPGVALFPVLPAEEKNDQGTGALREDTLVLRAVRRLKTACPELAIFTDIALDPYTTHGHDGVLTADQKDVDNDATVEILCRMACLHAAAGVDMVAPSDMMDGRVGAIRESLDQDGFTGTGILAYAAKFASAFYGPFREAVGSARKEDAPPIDKRTYQLNPANRREAMQDALLDEAEGADILMVKPAGPYLDILADLRVRTDLPLAAYQVSGEYAMLQAADEKGWLDLRQVRDESLLGIKRAGADMILTYFARSFSEDFAAS